MLEPYRRLAAHPQPAETSILMARPATPFTGLWQAVRLWRVFSSAVALTGILSAFAPIFLANVSFRLTLTFTTHLVCTWTSVSLLAAMIALLVFSFFVTWPKLDVEPSTIAGCIYHVCDSSFAANLEGLSTAGQKERDRRVREVGRRYCLARRVGVSDESRLGIDYADNCEKYSVRRLRRNSVVDGSP